MGNLFPLYSRDDTLISFSNPEMNPLIIPDFLLPRKDIGNNLDKIDKLFQNFWK